MKPILSSRHRSALCSFIRGAIAAYRQILIYLSEPFSPIEIEIKGRLAALLGEGVESRRQAESWL
ncbi:hypothetical protein [Mesorhizobium sp. STM 4661]|uniref:hypothetical protein n=1 Tax=Mesorhizobium sp. STM 4661 TaxID=1297570 RepID=UPI0002BF99F8|nr:hypothetical protein [Mesorhizobium sp. STM 4661]CCV15974.1 hypothetical protein MESS4_830194 [Mesorhizobium sp. STM 4661]